ncbi:hypothetical protein R1sor_003746 [Riccia sorocarpa]|uniref:Uncharacterized protein n=1 Tax=Riccia sorocarpa TaxID=122646 RepID=A0ABD3H5C5_9MARC
MEDRIKKPRNVGGTYQSGTPNSSDHRRQVSPMRRGNISLDPTMGDRSRSPRNARQMPSSTSRLLRLEPHDIHGSPPRGVAIEATPINPSHHLPAWGQNRHKHGAGRSNTVTPKSPSIAIPATQERSPVSLPKSGNASPRSPQTNLNFSASRTSWADRVDQEMNLASDDEDMFSMFALNSEKKANHEYMKQRAWIHDAKKEVIEAFAKIQEFTVAPEVDDAPSDSLSAAEASPPVGYVP